MITEFLMIFAFLKVLFCLLYMELIMRFYYGDSYLVKTKYQSQITPNVISTIYSNRFMIRSIRKRKLIVLLCGGFSLTLDIYLEKVMRDIIGAQSNDSVLSQYDIVVFENSVVNSLFIVQYVSEYIGDAMVDRDTLAIIGFSSGGIVGSHVMSNLKEAPYQRTLISYDSPIHVGRNILTFEKYLFRRLDLLFLVLVLSFYKKTVTWHQFISGSWAKETIRFICEEESMSYEELDYKSKFNSDLLSVNKSAPPFKYIHMRSTWDPCLCADTTSKGLDELKKVLPFQCVMKHSSGHCTDMTFGTTYLAAIAREL